MSILYTNAQSIVNKINELRSVVYDMKPDLVLIDESWTHKKITKAYLNIDGYDLCSRVDREDTTDGWVVVFLHIANHVSQSRKKQ